MKQTKVISIGLITIFTILVLAQFISQKTSTGGAWCSPYLDAPQESGHSAYTFVSYGFPISFITIAQFDCFSEQSTEYEWFPPGMIVDGFLFGAILLLWSRRERNAAT